MRLAGYVARMGRGVYRILMGKTEGNNLLEDPGLDARIIWKWTFKKWEGGNWTGLIWLRIDRWPAAVNAVMNLRVR